MTTIPTEDLTIDTFTGQTNGKPFKVLLDAPRSAQLILESVTPIPRRDIPMTRAPFSLFFKDPSPTEILPQKIYPLAHEDLGEMTIFLVPVGQDASGVTYQAVFN